MRGVVLSHASVFSIQRYEIGEHMKSFFVSICFLFIVKFFACNKPTPGDQAFPIEQFPLTIGSTWKYAIRDSVMQTLDTVLVSVVDSTILSDGTTAAVVQYAYGRSVEMQYVALSGDSLLTYKSPDVRNLSMILVFPMELGRQWTTSPPGSMKVTARESVNVPGGSFAGALRIEQHPFIGNFYGGTTYWFAPGTGLVRMHRSWMDTMADTRVNVIWELVSFQKAK
jgi:hypothetical protein